MLPHWGEIRFSSGAVVVQWESMRWIIGDIHGMFPALDALLGEIEKRDLAPHYIFVGDYINRGPDSPKVIERLLQLRHATFLRGNHDDVMDLILHDTCYMCHEGAPDALSAFAWFMQHGLDQTLTAYGADWAELDFLRHHPSAQRLRSVLSVVPEPHRRFIRDLRPVVEHADIFVAHAYWSPEDSDETPDVLTRLRASPKLRYQVLWGRFTTDQIKRPKKWKRTGYFGHTPVLNYDPTKSLKPLRGPQVVLVDTAAALVPHGRLSGVCAETGEVVQSERSGAIVR